MNNGDTVFGIGPRFPLPDGSFILEFMSEPTVLVRYGVISEVSRFAAPNEPVERGARVVVRTRRGLEIGTVLETVKAQTNGHSHDVDHGETTETILRTATGDDAATFDALQSAVPEEFAAWAGRIREWKLELELIDLEWTLDREKLILYVLGGRGPDCTKLALQAAAAGFQGIDVQPVDAGGLVQMPSSQGGGCGSGGCGCHV